MTISPGTIQIVKDSRAVLKEHGTEIVSTFYDTLFERYPEVRKQFNTYVSAAAAMFVIPATKYKSNMFCDTAEIVSVEVQPRREEFPHRFRDWRTPSWPTLRT